VAGQQQRDQFVADLAVRQGFSVLIPGIEQELGDIVTALSFSPRRSARTW